MKFTKVIGIVLFLLTVSTASQALSVESEVEIGYGGVCKLNSWNPVTIRLSNPERNIDGSAVVYLRRGTQTLKYSTPVNLATSSKKQFTIYIPLQEYSRKLTIDILDGNKVVKKIEKEYRTAYDDEYMLVSVGMQQRSLNFLNGQQINLPRKQIITPMMSQNQPMPSGNIGQVQVGSTDPRSLPDKPAALNGVDMLVLADIDESRVDPKAISALKTWLATGGCVTVCGGADYAKLTTPLFREILPVNVKSSAEIGGLDQLGVKFGGMMASGNVFVTMADPKAGTKVEASQGGVPLIVCGRYGLGSVTFLAFDPMSFPINGWTYNTKMWMSVLNSAELSPRITTPEYQAISQNSRFSQPGTPQTPPNWISGIEQAALLMKAIQPPSISTLGFFLVVYLVVLVPINYFYLRKKGKYEIAWITTPAIIVFFTLGAYVVGFAMRGNQTILNRIALIETSSDTTSASVVEYLGMYSAKHARYDIDTEDPAGLASEGGGRGYERYPSDPADVSQGDDPGFKNVALRQWSGRTFRTESGIQFKGRMKCDLKVNGSKLEGVIKNNTGVDFRDCTICYGRGRQSVAVLRSGESFNVSVDILSPETSGAVDDIQKPYREARDSAIVNAVSYSIADKITWSREPVFAGWIDRMPTQVRVGGHDYDGEKITLALIHLKIKTTAKMAIKIDPYRAELVDVRNGGKFSHHYANNRLIIDTMPAGSRLTVDYLPTSPYTATLDLHTIRLRGTCRSASGKGPEAYCIDWWTGKWDYMGNTDGIKLPEPVDHHRRKSHCVRIRFEAKEDLKNVCFHLVEEGKE